MNISVKRHARDNYHAWFSGRPDTIGKGVNEDEAIGNLLRLLPEVFTITVAPPDPIVRLDTGNLWLGELIQILGQQDQAAVVRNGFTHPHSYRGYYDHLAFVPTSNVPVKDMLDFTRRANHREFGGWKGGDFYMDEETPVWLSEVGSSDGAPLTAELLEKMLGEKVPQ